MRTIRALAILAIVAGTVAGNGAARATPARGLDCSALGYRITIPASWEPNNGACTEDIIWTQPDGISTIEIVSRAMPAANATPYAFAQLVWAVGSDHAMVGPYPYTPKIGGLKWSGTRADATPAGNPHFLDIAMIYHGRRIFIIVIDTVDATMNGTPDQGKLQPMYKAERTFKFTR